MIDQFEFDGSSYKALDARIDRGCLMCSFNHKPCEMLIKLGDIPPCQDWKRADKAGCYFCGGTVMTDLSKHIASTYLILSGFGLWDDTMRRAVISAKYKESQKWAKSS